MTERRALLTAIETTKKVPAISKLPRERVGQAAMNAPVVHPPPTRAPRHMTVAAAKLVTIAFGSRTLGVRIAAAARDDSEIACASQAPGNTPAISAARQTMSGFTRGTISIGRPMACATLPTAARIAPENPRYPPAAVATTTSRPPATPAAAQLHSPRR